MENISRWGTLFELKEDHKQLGIQGMIYFIVDFPTEISTGEMKYMISYPTFTGLGVSTGIMSFIVTEKELEELFTVMDKTFNQYAKEMEEEYFENRRKEDEDDKGAVSVPDSEMPTED